MEGAKLNINIVLKQFLRFAKLFIIKLPIDLIYKYIAIAYFKKEKKKLLIDLKLKLMDSGPTMYIKLILALAQTHSPTSSIF